MLKSSTLALAALVAASLSAQQITLDWATEVVPANNRVKTASDGGVFALGTGDNSAVIQHLSSSGTVLWTKTLSAPTLYAIDMDVDGSDNIYIYVGFTTGQVDLDPGPNTTLVDPGKVYAKYNSNGQFQWGFSLENSTDLSEDYGGVSCDDAGNLYICGDLGQGVYDFDFGAGVNELTVGDFSTGSFMARYRPDGSLAWANIETYYGGFSNSRDITAMRDGSSFFVVRELDNGGPLSSQIDVDYGPGVYNVYNETMHILRYDSALQFMAQAYANYGDVRMCADAAGSAYLMAQAQAGAGFQAVKFNQAGQAMEQVYSTPLPVSGNLRLGDIAPDEQGGCLGMYSNNGPGGVIRFYKMNVSGLVDFNLTISQGNDYTLPGGKGFDLDGGALYFGTYNQNYTVDFDPGPGVLNLPATSTNDGVVARFDWCQGAPFDPFEINTAGALCAGQPITFTVSAFGDASSYEWTFTAGWTIIEGQGTGTITVLSDVLTSGSVSVSAVNTCGTSAPIALDFSLNNPPVADAGPDLYACTGDQVILFANPPGATYLWQDGSTNVSFAANAPGVYSVEVTVNGCSDSDEVTVVWQPLPTVELGPDQVICPGESVVLDAGNPGAEYQWFPEGFGSQQTITVTPDSTTDYTVFVNVGGCIGLDGVAIIVDPCLGMEANAAGTLKLWPVPVSAGELLQATGSRTSDVLGLSGADGRVYPLRMVPQSDGFSLRTDGLAPGTYVLRLSNGTALPIMVR